MAQKKHDNIKLVAPKPLDARYYGKDSKGWKSTEDVLNGIPVEFRFIGLTVLVKDEENYHEYWFKDGVENGNLVYKYPVDESQISDITTNFNEKIDNLTNKINQTNENVTNLDADVDDLEGRVATNETNIQGNKSSIQDLNSDVTKNTDDIKNLGTKVDANTQEINGVKEDVTENTNKLNTVESTANSALDKANTNSSEINAVKGDVGTNTSEIENLKGKVSTNTSEISNVKNYVSANTTKIESLEGVINGHTTEINNIKEDVTENTSKIGTVEEKANDAVSKATANTQEINNIKEDVTENTSKIGTVEEKANDAVSKATANTQEINTVKSDLESTKEDVAENTEEISKLKGRVSTNETSILNVRSTADNALNTANNNTIKIGNVELKVNTNTSEISNVKQDVNAVTSTANTALGNSNTNASEIEILKNKLNGEIEDAIGNLDFSKFLKKSEDGSISKFFNERGELVEINVEAIQAAKDFLDGNIDGSLDQLTEIIEFIQQNRSDFEQLKKLSKATFSNPEPYTGNINDLKDPGVYKVGNSCILVIESGNNNILQIKYDNRGNEEQRKFDGDGWSAFENTTLHYNKYGSEDKFFNEKGELVYIDLQGILDQIGNLQLTVEGNSNEIYVIRQKLNTVTSTANNALSNSVTNRDDINSVRSTANTALNKANTNTTEISNVKQNVITNTTKISEVEDTANAAKSTAESAKSTAESAQTQANKNKTEIGKVKSTAESAQTQANKNKTEIGKVKSTAESARSKANDASALATQANTKVKQLDGKVTTNISNIEANEQDIDDINANLSIINYDVNKNRQDISSLNSNLSSTKNKLNTVESKTNTNTSNISSITTDLTSTKNKLNTVKSTAESAKSTAESAKSTANSALSKANANASALNNKANKSDVYTKSQSDGKYIPKSKLNDLPDFFQRINGAKPINNSDNVHGTIEHRGTTILKNTAISVIDVKIKTSHRYHLIKTNFTVKDYSMFTLHLMGYAYNQNRIIDLQLSAYVASDTTFNNATYNNNGNITPQEVKYLYKDGKFCILINWGLDMYYVQYVGTCHQNNVGNKSAFDGWTVKYSTTDDLINGVPSNVITNVSKSLGTYEKIEANKSLAQEAKSLAQSTSNSFGNHNHDSLYYRKNHIDTELSKKTTHQTKNFTLQKGKWNRIMKFADGTRYNVLLTITGRSISGHTTATFLVQRHYKSTNITQLAFNAHNFGYSSDEWYEFNKIRTTQFGDITYGVCYLELFSNFNETPLIHVQATNLMEDSDYYKKFEWATGVAPDSGFTVKAQLDGLTRGLQCTNFNPDNHYLQKTNIDGEIGFEHNNVGIFPGHNNEINFKTNGRNNTLHFNYRQVGSEKINVINLKDCELTIKSNKVWHAGNDGSGSSLDADMLDGKHASDFIQLNNQELTDDGSKLTPVYVDENHQLFSKDLDYYGNIGTGIDTTQKFVDKLKSLGAITKKYVWRGKIFWNYSSNSIFDTGVGKIDFAGSLIEVFGVSNNTQYIIRVTTGPTGRDGSEEKSVFIYEYYGSGYNPGWNRLFSKKSPPKDKDIPYLVFGKRDSVRDIGIFGTYNYRKIQHIWSMGTGYKVAADGSDFGNLYGMAYKYGDSQTYAGYHQVTFVGNGSVGVSIGMLGDIWLRKSISFEGKKLSSTGTELTFNGKTLAFKDDIPTGGQGGDTSHCIKNNISDNQTMIGSLTATDFILSSDERLKENIKPYETKKIPLKLKQYNFKSDEDKNENIGVIAQELEESKLNEFVQTDKETGNKSVKYIQLLLAKVAELEARIEELESDK